MRILVTGGAGFIGSNIARAGLLSGFEVRVLDNLSTGSRSNIDPEVEFMEGDTSNVEIVKASLEDVDYVFHQAAFSSSPMFYPDPRRPFVANIQGFLNVLHHAAKNGVRKVVYALTSTMYGNTPIPWKESDASADRCPNAYAFSLFNRIFLAKLYAEEYGLETVGLVYFSVYGPNEKAKGKFANVITQFLWTMSGGDAPVIYGDGSQTRDFIHVSDVVKANFLAARSSISGEIVNVGTGVQTSMKDVVLSLNRLLECDLEPKYEPNPIQGYVFHSLADTTKAKNDLGFRPKVSVNEGLTLMIDHYVRSKGI